MLCSRLYDALNDIFAQYMPVSSSLVCTRTYHVWWDKYRKTGLSFYLDMVKRLRRKIKLEVHGEYYPKKFWRFIDKKRRTTNIPRNMTCENEVFTSQQEIVDAFVAHFSKVFLDGRGSLVCNERCVHGDHIYVYCYMCYCSSLTL